MAPETPSRLRFCPRQRRLSAWAGRPLGEARGAAGESSPAVVAHHITRRRLFIVAFWHLLSTRRRVDPAAPHHRPLPCPVALLSSPPFAPVTHRTAGPSARVTGARDGRGAAPSFEPSRATLGRVHRPAEHRSGDSDGPPDHRFRSCRGHGVSGGLGGADGVLAALVGVTTALLSPLPPRPWHPTHASLLRGARRHVQRLPRPTSPSRPPPRPRRWPRRPRRSPCGSFGSRAPSLSRPRRSPRPSPRPSGRRRRRGATSAPPEHLPGGQRLRSGAGGPCEPAGATSEYSKARASPLSPARRVSLTTPPPPGSGVHRAYKMAAGRTSSDAVSLARAVGNSLAGLRPSRAAASCAMRVPSAARPCPCPSHSDSAAGPVWRPGTTA